MDYLFLSDIYNRPQKQTHVLMNITMAVFPPRPAAYFCIHGPGDKSKLLRYLSVVQELAVGFQCTYPIIPGVSENTPLDTLYCIRICRLSGKGYFC